MVTFINKNRQTPNSRTNLVIELVGLAGAGKTTLTKALMLGDDHISNKIIVPRVQASQHLIAHTMTFLPTYLRHFPKLRWFTRDEMRAMIYLTAWPDIVSRPSQKLHSVQLLDLGPVYRLTFLQEFGSQLTKQPLFIEWCDQVLQRWRSVIDLLIWLDAPNEVLLDRIKTREKSHVVKERSQEESKEFFTRYRAGYERIISQWAANEGPPVLRIDSSQFTVSEIQAQITTVLQQHHFQAGQKHKA